MEIKNYNQLITKLKQYSTTTEKLENLMNYFLENVQYDYVTLEICKLQKQYDKIFKLDEQFDCNNFDDRQKVIQILKSEGYSDELCERINANYGKEYILPAVPKREMWGRIYPEQPERTCVRNLFNAINLTEKPTEENEGLLTKGVCADYSQFVKKVCDDLDIKDCNIINGETMVSHVWNVIEGKVYDPTYAIFARDNYESWGKATKPSDWLNVSFDHILELQPYRIVLEPNINGEQYNQN